MLDRRLAKAMSRSGGDAGIAAYGKLTHGTFDAERALIGMELARGQGIAWDEPEGTGASAALTFLNGRINSIAGGSDQMQRNGISEQVLGLPPRAELGPRQAVRPGAARRAELGWPRLSTATGEGEHMSRFLLPDDGIPSAWFNVLPVMPEPLQPPLHPGTKEPIGPDDLAPLFPMGLIAQEVSAEPWIDIPGEVLDILRLWRPTPLVRAERLERAPRHAGAHLLQGRVGVAGRVAQAEHRGAAGVLQQGRGHHAPDAPRPAPASGAPRWRSPARSSTSSARSTWCGPRTSRSRTARS